MRPKKMLILMALCTVTGFSKDLGTVSKVLSIKEQSLIEVIQHRLNELQSKGGLEKHQQEIQKRAVASVERPKAAEGITQARAYASKLYDPSIVMSEDIKDAQGKIIIKKGTKYNPLDDMSFGEPLLFIDGDDSEQVQWSLTQKGKKVLVKGAPLKLARHFKTHFYFDQGGGLTQKLGIDVVPAKVSQKDKHLLIESIPIEGVSE